MTADEPPFDLISALNQSFKERLERDVLRLRTHPPDPLTHPVSNAIARAYLARLEAKLSTPRDVGEEKGIAATFDHIAFGKDMKDFWLWIPTAEAPAPALTEDFENSLGNLLVASGFSYSEAKHAWRKTREIIKGKGAPNKRKETLNMLDARAAKKWSYRQIANAMCKCGASRHTEGCSERIRKRIKELEAFLDKYQISYRDPA